MPVISSHITHLNTGVPFPSISRFTHSMVPSFCPNVWKPIVKLGMWFMMWFIQQRQLEVCFLARQPLSVHSSPTGKGNCWCMQSLTYCTCLIFLGYPYEPRCQTNLADLICPILPPLLSRGCDWVIKDNIERLQTKVTLTARNPLHLACEFCRSSRSRLGRHREC